MRIGITGLPFLRSVDSKAQVNSAPARLRYNNFGYTLGGPVLPVRKKLPPPASSTVTNWSVTQRFVSVTGPDNCWVRNQRQRLTGAVFPNLPMTVTRSNGVIRFDGSFFQVNYVGTYTGTELTASGVAPLEGGGGPCQDGTSFTPMAGVSALSGSFSADDQRATLTEVNSYRLTTGEPITYTWDWQATRRP